jgi:cell division protein FtsB
MTQRRTPSGQGPARRPGQASRTGLAGRAGQPGRAGQTGRAGQSSRTGTARAATPRGGTAPVAGRVGARRGAPAGAAKRTAAPRPRRLTGRATVLLVILTALALGYTYPVRVYLDQESDIARIEAAQEEQRVRIQGLREEVAKWQDDEYVRIQAKRRFYFVRPGETPLIPVWGDQDPAAAGDPAAPATEQDAEPWYDTLWSSIRAADEQPR